MKNWTKEEMMLARIQALTKMKDTALTAYHQVLGNDESALNKRVIEESGMTHKLFSTTTTDGI